MGVPWINSGIVEINKVFLNSIFSLFFSFSLFEDILSSNLVISQSSLLSLVS